MSAFAAALRSLFAPRWKRHAIPSMDGAWHPNTDLEAVPVRRDGLAQPDDVLPAPDGSLWVSAGRRLLRLSRADHAGTEIIEELPGEAGALAEAPGGGVAVCVAGQGVVVVGGDLDGFSVREVAGAPLRCATAVVFGPGGTLFVAEGSREHGGADWQRDLMGRGASGRVLQIDPESGRGEVVLDGLEWPYGLAVAHGDAGLLVTESWAHRVLRVPLDATGKAAARGAAARAVVVPNLPGYPARLSRSADGGYWMCVFAMRTQLIELVLEDHDYRLEMMRTIEPKYWIAPQLVTADDFLDPLQGGNIKQLGIKKPWAPPRAYGLIAKLDAELDCQATLHSRNGGTRHGITGARERGGALHAVSRGHGLLLRAEVSTLRGGLR